MAQPNYKGGTLRVASAGDTAEALKATEQEESRKAALDQESPAVVGLTGYLAGVWERNRKHKEDDSTGVQAQMVKNLQARNNEYSPEKLAEITAAGMPDVYMGLTNVKCAHAEAWLADIFSSTDRSWGLKPTPVPDPAQDVFVAVEEFLNKKIMEYLQEGGEIEGPEDIIEAYESVIPLAEEMVALELQTRANAMEAKIHDQMLEGGWDSAFDDFLSDVVTLKAGILKGPVIRKHERIEWVRGEEGKVSREVRETLRPEFERVSPLDIYPSPTATDVNEGSLVEKVRFSRADLVDLKEASGYDADAIDRVLDEFPRAEKTLTSTSEEDIDDVQGTDTTQLSEFMETIEGLEFWCPVQGKTLIEYGVDKIPGISRGDLTVEPLGEYQVNAIMVDNVLIYVDLNDHPLGHRPYSKTGWRKIPGSFWYKGVPELMEDLQRIINAAIRSMCYNMAIASGPQIDVDVDRLVPGEDIEASFPGKVWQTLNRAGVNTPAVKFLKADSNANELFGVYENFARLADDYTGIPAYAYGSDRVAGAGRTSSGLSMLMSSAAKGVKRVILGIDHDIFKTLVRRQFDWNMQYGDDDSVKGDVEIVTTGAVGVMVKEQMSERRMNFLNITNNPVDERLIGSEGRANVLREAASSLELEDKKIVKTPEEIREMVDAEAKQSTAREEMEQQVQQAEMQLRLQGVELENETKKLKMRVEMAKLEFEQQKIALEAQKLGLKVQEAGVNAQKVAGELAVKQADTQIKAQEAATRTASAEAAASAKAAEVSAKVAKDGVEMFETLDKKDSNDVTLNQMEDEASAEAAQND